ncbi:MAG: hypothetical protein WCW78_02880 [Candidatus Paceibacterota bacterium]|jgi:hypothetical protein
MSPTFETQPNKGDEFTISAPSAGLPWRLMIFSGVLFAFSIFIFFGIRFGYTGYLDNQSTQIDQQLETLAKKINETDQEKFIGFYSQIVNLRMVLEKHLYISNVFKILEKYTIQPVVFKDASFDTVSNAIQVNGSTDSFNSLAQQMAILGKAPEITRVSLDTISLQLSGGVNFLIKLQVQPAFLLKAST